MQQPTSVAIVASRKMNGKRNPSDIHAGPLQCERVRCEKINGATSCRAYAVCRAIQDHRKGIGGWFKLESNSYDLKNPFTSTELANPCQITKSSDQSENHDRTIRAT